MANNVTYNGKTYNLDTQEGLNAYLNARGGPSEQAVQDIADETYAKQYGGGMSAAELSDFETLVGRLEKSKMKQAGQANRARQRDVFAGGLASMMGNF